MNMCNFLTGPKQSGLAELVPNRNMNMNVVDSWTSVSFWTACRFEYCFKCSVCLVLAAFTQLVLKTLLY